MRRSVPACQCDPPNPARIYDPVGGFPDRCAGCGGVLWVAAEEQTFTPVRWWPWLVALLVLDLVLLVAAWVAFGGPGLNSQPSQAPRPTPSPASFSQEQPGVELVPSPVPW